MKSVKTRFRIYSYFLISGLILAMTPILAQAETKYVSDQLVITMRTGQGTQFHIIKTLQSGEHVEVLETTETGYSRVKTSDGTEGWVRTQYLESEPSAKEKLIDTQAELNKTRIELKKIKENYSTLNEKYKSVSQNQEKLNSDKKKTDAELVRISELAKKPILLERLNRKLQLNNVNLEKDLQRLNQENHSLKDRSQREWFILGALVLFGGLILGLVIPKLRGRKRTSW